MTVTLSSFVRGWNICCSPIAVYYHIVMKCCRIRFRWTDAAQTIPFTSGFSLQFLSLRIKSPSPTPAGTGIKTTFSFLAVVISIPSASFINSRANSFSSSPSERYSTVSPLSQAQSRRAHGSFCSFLRQSYSRYQTACRRTSLLYSPCLRTLKVLLTTSD